MADGGLAGETPVFDGDRLEKAVRVLTIVSGAPSLAGLIGVPLEDMQLRLIGVLGYAGLAPIVFLIVATVISHPNRARRALGGALVLSRGDEHSPSTNTKACRCRRAGDDYYQAHQHHLDSSCLTNR
jgi:hypothetical protein